MLTAAEADARRGPGASGFARRPRGAVGRARVCTVHVHVHGVRVWCAVRAYTVCLRVHSVLRVHRCTHMVSVCVHGVLRAHGMRARAWCVRARPRASSACSGVWEGPARGLRWQHVRTGEKGRCAGVTWPRARSRFWNIPQMSATARCASRSQERPGFATCGGQGLSRWRAVTSRRGDRVGV